MDGTPIINKQYDTTRLINFYLRMLTLVKLLMSLELQRPKLWAVYLPTSLLIYICTSLSHPSIQTLPSCQTASSLNIHTQSRTATYQTSRSRVIIICQIFWSTRSIDLKRLLILLRAIEIAKSSDFIRRIWMIDISPSSGILDRVGYLGYGYYFRFWFLFTQLTYKKRLHEIQIESYALFGIDEVDIYSLGDSYVM